MTESDIAPALMVTCFGLLVFALSRLARIQVEAIAHLRKISHGEAKRVYYEDYTDGDGAHFSWSEMRSYCRVTGASARLRFWIIAVIMAIAGGIGSIVLDKALR